MKLLFKEKIFSWLGGYEIFDEEGRTIYNVKGQLSWGHCLKVFDANGNELGMIKQKVFSFLPKFEIYIGAEMRGYIRKELSFFKPRFNIDYNGWTVEGNLFEWDYKVRDTMGLDVATVTKEFFQWTDTYSIDVADSANALSVLLLVIAIDAEKNIREDRD